MTATQTIEAIHRHLDECPTDWTARLQLADLLEDAGRDDEARYQRWAVEHERAPVRWLGNWHWWSRGDLSPSDFAVIGSLVKSIPTREYAWGGVNREDAEADLMRVLIELGWPAPGVE